MTQGATTTFTLTFPSESVDLTLATKVMFTIAQGMTFVDKIVSSLTETTAAVSLDQEDTLKFRSSERAGIQLNWVYADGSRGCSKVVMIDVEPNLHKAVIEQ